jgi:Na+/H+-dicarboxylate symporter
MSTESPRKFRLPLVAQILVALVAATVLGSLAHEKKWNIQGLQVVSDVILDALRMLATPLIFTAVVLSLFRAKIEGGRGGKLVWLLATNTLAAIVIGLLVANFVQPGTGAQLEVQAADHEFMAKRQEFNVVNDLLKKIIPKSAFAPFAQNDVLGVVFLSILTALALRALQRKGEAQEGIGTVESLLDTIFQLVLIMLHWLFYAVPLAVFAVVSTVVAKSGFGAFASFGKFVGAVLLALLLQALWYLGRLRLNSWVSWSHFLKSGAEAFFVAFSTASSTATLPVTYRCATTKMGLREENARLGTMVGGNLNNDGTALYEAMAALFIAQAMGMNLPLSQQLVIVAMAVVASVGAAGIPEAGLVTMMAVFSAVKLPVDYIPLLLTVDWFLDRCRTAMNVMGDLTVSAVLDGKQPNG